MMRRAVCGAGPWRGVIFSQFTMMLDILADFLAGAYTRPLFNST
jgi:hypothetical protein